MSLSHLVIYKYSDTPYAPRIEKRSKPHINRDCSETHLSYVQSTDERCDYNTNCLLLLIAHNSQPRTSGQKGIMNVTASPTGAVADVVATDAFGLSATVLTIVHYILLRVLVLCIAAYSTWQYLLRSGALWNSKSEPPMLPYWLPGNPRLCTTYLV